MRYDACQRGNANNGPTCALTITTVIRRAAAAVVVIGAVCLGLGLPSASRAQSTGELVNRARDLSSRVHELKSEVEDVQKTTNSVFLPITVLIGILAAGGALGVVFSFRDQRRTSQLHELTV